MLLRCIMEIVLLTVLHLRIALPLLNSLRLYLHGASLFFRCFRRFYCCESRRKRRLTFAFTKTGLFVLWSGV